MMKPEDIGRAAHWAWRNSDGSKHPADIIADVVREALKDADIDDAILHARRCAGNLAGKYTHLKEGRTLIRGDIDILETAATELRRCADILQRFS